MNTPVDSRLPLGARVLDALRLDIVNQQLAPGSALLESELCERYSASRTPVREALRMLEAEGVVSRNGQNVPTVPPMSKADALNVYSTRAALEALAARQLSGRASKQDLQDLRRLVAVQRQVAGGAEPEVMVAEGGSFHRRIAELSGNQPAQRALLSLRVLSDRYRRFAMTNRPERPAAAFQEHAAIVDAIEAGDGEWAHALMLAHVMSSYHNLQLALN